MEAHRASATEGARQEDVILPADGVEPRSEANIISPPTEPNVVPLETEQLLSSSTEPTADAAGRPR